MEMRKFCIQMIGQIRIYQISITVGEIPLREVVSTNIILHSRAKEADLRGQLLTKYTGHRAVAEAANSAT